jgi:hypothetical protein
MKKCIVVLIVLLMMPMAAWAQEFSNAELYQMIKNMELKFDQAIEQTNRAMAEAEKAKEEAALAKDEAARAKAEVALAKEETARVQTELAQIKAASESTLPTEVVPAEPLIREAKTVPGLGASFEAIYMRPSRDDLDYVVSDDKRTGNIQGSYKTVNPDYSGGARLGLSYTFDSGTAVRAQYTMLDTSDSDYTEKTSGVNDLWGTWLHANAVIDDNDVTSAEMQYDFDLDVFDLSAHKSFDVGRDFGLGIDAGLRYAHLKQDIEINYRQDITPAIFRTVDVYSNNDFTGWGPRAGMDLDWRMGKGFSLFGSLAGSLLLGDFDLAQKEQDRTVGAVNYTTRVDVDKTEKNRLVPVVEMRAGLGYAYQLENGMSVGAKVGYEWQNWFNMVTTQRYLDDVDNQLASTDTSDLSLDGFFLEGFLNF